VANFGSSCPLPEYGAIGEGGGRPETLIGVDALQWQYMPLRDEFKLWLWLPLRREAKPLPRVESGEVVHGRVLLVARAVCCCVCVW